ncbi:MAG: PQQ-binding-like beta-propeller repeat protein [Acidobacteria bacterium]|nr:PQQ-binding-like beta-propeller repeat protein [Acidobacteriota bacterium]
MKTESSFGKNLVPVILLAAILFLPASMARGGDEWSRFRGPNGAGISPSKGLPNEFGAGKNMLWKTPLPAGHSSPVLTNDKIFVTAFEGEKLSVYCINRKDGKQLWQRDVPKSRKNGLQKPNNPASPSPVTDGQNVYAFFQDYGLISFDGNGKERWKLPLGPFNIFFGFGASPILVDGLVILPADQDTNPFMIAVEQNSGKVRWKVDRPGVISGYSTPTVYKPKDGGTQIIIPESFQLTAYSVATGEKVWWVRGLAPEMKSVASYDNEWLYVNGWGLPTGQPGKQVKVIPWDEALAKYDTNHDGKITSDEAKADPTVKAFSSPQFDFFSLVDLDKNGHADEAEWNIFRAVMAAENGLLSIHMGGKGDMTAGAIRWRYQKPVPQVPSTLLYQGVLYMVNDSGILISFDPATGNVIKQGRLQGAIDKYFASPVGADGKVYLVSQDGTVSVVKAVGEWEVLAVSPLGEEVYATPAIADGRIYLRTQSALYCFGN